MQRTELIAQLSACTPALAASEVLPVLGCYCFGGGRVTAFNDVVAIASPCAFEFEGGLPGKPLMACLSNSRAKEVVLVEQTDTTTKLKVGNAKLELATAPTEDFVFEWPKSTKGMHKLEVTDDLLRALRLCALCMGEDPTYPWRMGVTFSSDGKRLTLYSTNNLAVAECPIKSKLPKFAVAASPAFVRQLLSMAKPGDVLYLDSTRTWLRCKDKCMLLGRSVAECDPAQYRGVLALFKKAKAEWCPKPPGISAAFKKAAAVLGTDANYYATVTARNGQLQVAAKSSVGEVKDRMRYGGKRNVTVSCNPNMVAAAMVFADNVALADGFAMALGSEYFTYLVTVAA